MSRFVSVEGFPGFVRDRTTNAILNMDTFAIEEARRRKAIRKEKRNEEQTLKNKVEKIESDMEEIKELLKTLLNNNL